MKGFRARLDFLLKHNFVLQKLYKKLGSLFFRCIGFFMPIDPNLVLFSGHGRAYNDSPRALYEQMLIDPRFQGMQFVWAVEKPETVPPGCRVVKPDTREYFSIALRAKYWVTCVNIERGLVFKKKKQVYLNTWHGVPMKTIGNGAGNRKDYDFSHIDIFCCSGAFEIPVYMRDFTVRRDALLYSGLPRNDILYNATEEDIRAARERVGVPEGKQVILYAPTWRDSVDDGKTYSIKPPVDMARWARTLGDNTVFFVRAHAYTTQMLGIQFNDSIRDATEYPNVNDLLLVADVLVSDYSAIQFDYAILERPIVCFGYDYEQYVATRGMYIDLDAIIPGGVMHTEDEVLERLTHLDPVREKEQVRLFKQRFLEVGGNACNLCLDSLLQGSPVVHVPDQDNDVSGK